MGTFLETMKVHISTSLVIFSNYNYFTIEAKPLSFCMVFLQSNQWTNHPELFCGAPEPTNK